MTPRDVDQVLEALNRMRTDFGVQLARLEERFNAASSHEDRISALERSGAILKAFVAALGLLFPAAIAVLLSLMNNH